MEKLTKEQLAGLQDTLTSAKIALLLALIDTKKGRQDIYREFPHYNNSWLSERLTELKSLGLVRGGESRGEALYLTTKGEAVATTLHWLGERLTD